MNSTKVLSKENSLQSFSIKGIEMLVEGNGNLGTEGSHCPSGISGKIRPLGTDYFAGILKGILKDHPSKGKETQGI